MPVDLGQLRVTAVIVHEVPYHLATASSGEPVLSEVESPVTSEVRNYFRERISDSLGTAAYEVEVDPGTTSPVPRLVLDGLTATGDGFVPTSQEMARHLYLCQKGSSPEGLLIVCKAEIGSQPALAILKLEKEQGAQVQLDVVDGARTFNVQHLHNLMLTEKTKVFKVGLFVATGTTLEGSVCDTQKGYGGTVAHFFLKQFLGCQLRELPELTTKNYLETAEAFINESVDDPEKRARYEVALLADLSNQRDTVSPRNFVRENFGVEDRQPFVKAVSDAGVPANTFAKDITLVKSHLSRIQMAFHSGIKVIARPEHVGREMLIDQLDNGATRVQITDDLDGLTGRS